MRGRFIALEGVDGAGKSTQAALLAAALREAGRDVVTVREPGGTAVGEAVRGVLLGESPVTPWAEALLFAAARAELVSEVVRPALEAGRWVVADRFVDSSLAYQGAARGLGLDAVWAVNAAAVDGCLPHLVVVLDLDVAEAALRGRARGGPDRIEGEGEGLQRAVGAAYRELARRHPDRMRVVDAAGGADEVHARVMAVARALA